MAEQLELEAQKREIVGKATKRLRRAGIIPANISGHNEEPVALQVDAVAFDYLLRKHGTRGVFTLRLPEGNQSVLVRHVQHKATSGAVLHIDFERVSLHDRLAMKIPLAFIGEAPGVKIEGGALLHLLDALEVQCRASDIVETLEVDISALTDLNSMLHAKNVKLPANYTLVTDPEEPIAKIEAPRVQEEATAASTEAAAPTATETKSE